MPAPCRPRWAKGLAKRASSLVARDGDNRVDYQLRINGDQTANTNIANDQYDVNGGWYLFGAAP